MGARRVLRDPFPILVGVITAAVLGILLIYPIGKALLSSFVPQGEALALKNLSLVNFQRFVTSPLYKSALVNSILVSLATTFFATILALPAAYAMARIKIPLKSLAMSLSVIPLIAPPFIGAYSWVLLLGRRGIVTVFPGKGALGTFSPLLDPEGNSVRGGLAARDLARRLGLDVLASEAADSGATRPQG